MARWMAGMAAYVISMTVATASMASTVRYDYDREVEFSKWKIVAFPASGPVDLSLPERRIRRALESGFKTKGYTFAATPDSADFVIAYHAAAWREPKVNDTFRGPGFGRSLQVERVPMGILIVNLVDRKSGKVAWHGEVVDEIAQDAEKADKKTAKDVEKLLEKFPPLPKK